jgi:hypothetical protein
MSHDLQEELEEENAQNEHFMKDHDMVFSKSQNGDITGGGFSINSMLLKNITKFGGSPIETLQTMIGGEKQDENIKSMVVPFGLFYKQEKMLQKSLHNSKKETDTDVNDDNEISDDLYDQLLKKVDANDNDNRSSRRNNRSKKSKKTEKKESRKNKASLSSNKKTAKSIHT